MKITGFTFVRDAIKLDYPIIESIQSILPLCHELVIAVGHSQDGTRQLIQQLQDPKIRIIDTHWDDTLRKGGKVLALETDKAKAAISPDTDWCIYLQADEVIHEKYHQAIRTAMQQHKDNPQVEGLLLKYYHFYGSFDYIADSRKWYRQEIRIIKNDPQIKSYRDAQGFRKNGQKLTVKAIPAYVYHYGWVRHPKHQQLKQRSSKRYWHSDGWIQQNLPDADEFDYTNIDTLAHFKGTHPKVMQARIDRMNWKFTFDPTQRKLTPKERLSRLFEQITGYRIGEYKNYKLLK